MEQRKLMDFFAKVALLFTGIAIGIVCVIMFLNFSEYWAYIVGIGNILVIGLGYFTIRYIYEFRLRKNIRLSTTAVKNMFNENITPVKPKGEEFGALYDEILAVKNQIEEQTKSRQNIFNIVASVAANMDLQSMLEDMMPQILETTRSNCGAFYLANLTTNRLEIKYSVGFNNNIYNEFDIVLGEGLVGDIAQKKEIKIINNIPEDTVYIARTFLGNIKPKSIMVVPTTNNDLLAGVLVLASIQEYATESFEQASLIRYYLGIAIGNGITLDTNKRLASELKFQNKLIQDFNTELEKKVAERSLLFDNIINSIQEYGIYSMDRNGYITTWNKGAENLAGYKANEVIGKHVDVIYPEDEVKNGLVQRRLNLVKSKGKFNESIWRNKKGGVKYYADVTIYAIKNDKNELMGYTNVTRDITGIKIMENTIYAERDFRNKILSENKSAIVLSDETAIIRFANKSAEALLGISFDKMKSHSLSDFFIESQQLHNNIMKIVTDRKTITLEKYTVEINGNLLDIQVVPLKDTLPDASVMFIITPTP